MALTSRQIEFMKPDPEKRVEIPDGNGLYLVVQASGRKSWAVRYRWRGRPSKLTLGSFPDLSLAQARAESRAALESLEQGIDPATKKALEEDRAPNSVAQVANEWLQRKVLVTKSGHEVQRILEKDVLPHWKRKLITEVGRSDVLTLLDSIVDRPAPVLANRVLSIMKRWFNWSVERGYLENSPVAALRPPSRERSRDRVLDDEEVLQVWQAAGRLGYRFGRYFQVLLLTAQRRGEVSAMRWTDVDLNAALWTLSAQQTKAHRRHDVPLSAPVLEILAGLPRFTGGPFVFTSTGGAKPLSGFSTAKEALDAEIIKGGGKLEPWTVHDLRRTAASGMAKMGVPPQVLSAILNHAPASEQGVTAIYNRFRYTEERREALQLWAEYVVGLSKKMSKTA